MRSNLETGLRLILSMSNRTRIEEAFNEIDPELLNEPVKKYITEANEGLNRLLKLCESYLDKIEKLRLENGQLMDAQINLLLKMNNVNL